MGKVLSPATVESFRERGFFFPVPALTRAEALGAGTHPRILDAIEDLLGPDLLRGTTSMFTKEPRTPGFVTFHQNSTYWGLEPKVAVTAWVALSDCPLESGPMRFVPGSHRTQLMHRDTFHADNLLTRGQEVEATAPRATSARSAPVRSRRPAVRYRASRRGAGAP